MNRRQRILVAAGLLAPACSLAPTAHRGRADSSANPPAEAGPDATAAAREAASSTGPAPTSSAGAAPFPAPADATVVVSGLPPDVEGTTTTRIRQRPTTTLPEDVDEDLTDEEWWSGQPGHQTPLRAAVLACIRSYEQGSAGYATDTGNGFYGAYQFDMPTWRSVGGSGNPAHASPAEQDDRAWALYLARGLQPWPTPAKRCAG